MSTILLNFLIGGHILAVLLLKKDNKDLCFPQYIHKNQLLSFIFRWRREISMLATFTFLLTSMYMIIFLVLAQYIYIAYLCILSAFMYCFSLLFIIQIGLHNRTKKLLLLSLYYAAALFVIILHDNLYGLSLAILFLSISFVSYEVLDYVPLLDKQYQIKIKKERKIKDYVDFILIYIIREQIYLELAIFSVFITGIPLSLHVLQKDDLLLQNIALIGTIWNLLIIQMSALIAVGFSELINFHRYFLIKNKFNPYSFTFLYFILAFMLSSIFVVGTGIILSLIKISLLDLPMTFIELMMIILLGMFVSLFFPDRRKKVSALCYGTITVLWMISKHFLTEKIGSEMLLLILILGLLFALLYVGIIAEIKELEQGVVIKDDN